MKRAKKSPTWGMSGSRCSWDHGNRPWNALLQGQFRHSDLHYSASEVRPVLLEAWAGVTRQVSRDYWVSWVLRYLTSELKTAPGDHDLLWGSVFINRYF